MNKEIIKNYLLSSPKDLVRLVKQFNSYNGSFDYADTFMDITFWEYENG